MLPCGCETILSIWKMICEDLPTLAEQVRVLRDAMQKDPDTGG